MRVLLTGGGTGGHIYPALALARHLRQTDPEVEILYVGTLRGMESELVPKAGLPFETIDVQGLPRKFGWRQVRALWRAWRSIGQARAILRRFRPDVVVGTGGYVCGPVVYAAHRLGIPTLIHEQNVVPGLTNRILARFVDVVAVSFPQTDRRFPKARQVVITGNPRVSEMMGVEEERLKALRRAYGLEAGRPAVAVFSGSRGAPPINRAAAGLLPRLVRERTFQLVWVTGRDHYEAWIRELGEKGLYPGVPGIAVVPFCDDMPALLRLVDAVVSRAGASTVAELTAVGVPAVLVPSPYVAGRHQEHNARWLAERGMAVMVEESELTPDRLYREILRVLQEGPAGRMRRRAQESALTEAAQTLAMVVRSLAERRR
ncbi:MAG: undecaprenyldiphospho-muramoylpentapeptide beta-N-acetylglucosaminyltransferase [Alicyclobacillaceae bacterium]|nr:undecaprenyldiphospho-muramoylpentapeptide beta-N-acetylglucosaminyltransferase [Alicyclobacillaceae bacterium]